MPRSVFRGRVTTAGEPAWLDSDRDWAMALVLFEADACPGCGQPRSQSEDPDAEGAYTAEAIRCWGCYAAEMASDDWSDGTGSRRRTAGVKFVASRREERR